MWVLKKHRYSEFTIADYTVPVNSEPEPDFFAGAEAGAVAGEKEPAPACCYLI